MDNVKDDVYYLNKIMDDLSFVIEHTKDKTQEDLDDDPVLVDSFMFRIIQIAENSDKLTKKFKEDNTDIPWKNIKGMRNRIVHDYGEVDNTIVYQTINESIPELYEKIEKLLESK